MVVVFCFFFCLEGISHECLCQFALRARRLVQCCVGRTFFSGFAFRKQNDGKPSGHGALHPSGIEGTSQNFREGLLGSLIEDLRRF